ncbi:hypothetical protein PhCBS80983_g05975 [Powellomyces hirtus]|uniref:Histidine kinase/HSP90-like ATPase domain-containing protein n=1 Tax=Powellomyces hirtus TaxID=109895 RepID=A0A507DTW5_9FUNG|nr:hypothetical protein PhCBS80983_g05975 [Powellomyces hirtus]
MRIARSILLALTLLLGTFALAAADASTGSAPNDSVASEPALKPPGVSFLTEDQEAKVRESGQAYQFETEVNKLMKLIINSLYKSKEIFLRELISNASDALDKIRFASLTDKDALGDTVDLKITLVADKERQTLTITDTGVGMTFKDLKSNLGTIAKSGTAEFLASVESQKNNTNLIGQFGVGFYSAFLIADRVTVVSKNNEDKQYIWESTSESDFRIIEDPRGNTLGRGTQIVLHVKKDALEYLEQSKLRQLVQRYSEFINFPIYLWASKTETEQVPVEDEPEAETPNDDLDDDIEDVTDKEEKDTKPKTKTITKTVTDWELTNQQKPIWTRRPADITEREYNEFYMSFTKDAVEPLAYNHFRAEGEVEFKSILFVPKKPNPAFLQSGDDWTHNVKLFVRRVFITDELLGFLPRWLSFLKGLVDSDDLPLNVSRETLQQHSIIKVIKKRVIAKAIDMFRTMAAKDEEKYIEFWGSYGNAIKLGVIEDPANKKKLMKLLRFRSSHSEKLTSLEQYVSRMRKGQPQIYFITGEQPDTFSTSPFVEKLIARGYEVLYFSDPIDEYLTNAVMDFDGKKLQHVGKSGLKYGDEDEKSGESLKEQEEKFKPLRDHLKERLSAWVDTVRVSQQLTTSPCAVLAGEYGVSGAMEKILQAQAIANKDDFRAQMYLNQKKVFEINPEHPLMIKMLEKVNAGKASELDDSIYVLFESTAIASGFAVRNPNDFAKKVEIVVRERLGVDLKKEAQVKVVPAPAVEEPVKSTQSSDDVDADAEAEESAEEAEEAPEHDEL